MGDPPEHRLLIVAGEASGDAHAARLVRALRAGGPIEVRGACGPAMREAGATSVVDVSDLSVIGFSGVVWLLKGHPSATSFSTGWNPFRTDLVGKAGFGLPANLTFFSFAILAMLGIETPLNMGVEVQGGEKAIRTYLLWGCAIVMFAYVWATWGNMVVIKAGGANPTTGGAQTVALAIGKWAGVIVALTLAWVLLTVAVVYNYAFGRLLSITWTTRESP